MKRRLGSDYEKYFTDSDGHAVSSLELLHYSETLRDRQIVDSATYRTNKESHTYTLLRRLVPVSKEDGIGIHL